MKLIEKIHNMQPTTIAVCLLLGIVALGIFCFNGYFYQRSIIKYFHAKSFEKIPCKIAQADAKLIANASLLSVRRHRSNNYCYMPSVVYTYDYGAIKEFGYTFSYFVHTKREKYDIQKIFNNTPEFISGECYVNPRNPSESVMSRSFYLWDRHGIRTILSALVLIVAGIPGYLGFINEYRRHCGK